MSATNLPLSVESPACGDTIRIRISQDDDGYTIDAPGFTLHAQADMSVAGTVEAIRAAHMLKAHDR